MACWSSCPCHQNDNTRHIDRLIAWLARTFIGHNCVTVPTYCHDLFLAPIAAFSPLASCPWKAFCLTHQMPCNRELGIRVLPVLNSQLIRTPD